MWQMLDYNFNMWSVKQAGKLDNNFGLFTACLDLVSVLIFWDILLPNKYFRL
jgi:hypothetical protein